MSLFNDKTYENLLSRAMARIPAGIDKREGSVVFNANAPSMAMLAEFYIALDFVIAASHIATAPREYLIMLGNDRSIPIKTATAAEFYVGFDIEVPIGSRFSLDDINVQVEAFEKTDESLNLYLYKAVCETKGAAFNNYSGILIPIQYIDGLKTAKITGLAKPGSDDEDTELYRSRLLNSIGNHAFGGNKADYEKKILDNFTDIIALKVIPVWNADVKPADLIPSEEVKNWFDSGMPGIEISAVKEWISAVYSAAVLKKLTVGGTVKIIVMATNYTAPTRELIKDIQLFTDPSDYAGEGVGIAPIGHVVNISGVRYRNISVSINNIDFVSGHDKDTSKSSIDTAINGYFTDLAKEWPKSDKPIIVIKNQLLSRILSNTAGRIKDLSFSLYDDLGNPYDENDICLEADEIPKLSDGGITYAV